MRYWTFHRRGNKSQFSEKKKNMRPLSINRFIRLYYIYSNLKYFDLQNSAFSFELKILVVETKRVVLIEWICGV